MIIGLCGLVIIGVALLALILSNSTLTGGADLTGFGLAIAAAVALVLVLNLGGIAILMSLHDRHVELAEEAATIADALTTMVERQVGTGTGEREV